MDTLASSSTLWSLEQAANQAGITGACLRNWVKAGAIEPQLFVNGRVPVFTGEQVEWLRNYVQDRRRVPA